MIRRFLLLTTLLLATACTLTTAPAAPEPPVETSEVVAAAFTETPTPTATSTALPTLIMTSTPRTAILPLPNCTLRTDWPNYVVAGGDTLASIARRIRSSISELTQANCLTDPNLINPGQQLHVPRLPVGLPDPSTDSGTVQISPFVHAEGGSYTVKANTPVTLTWPEVRRDATRIEFRSRPFASGSPFTQLGVDLNPADGATIFATFPDNFNQAISAVAYLPNGSQQSTISSIAVSTTPNTEQVQGEVVISPYLRTENGVHIVEAGQSVTVFWQGAPINQGSQFDFALIEAGSAGPQLVGLDNNSADGVSVQWIVPHSLNNARLVTGTRLPGQTHASIAARELLITSEVVIRDPAPVGNLTVAPILREDGGWLVLPADEVVTITWDSPPTDDVERVEFYLAPTGTGSTPQLIGTDDNPADGVSLMWEAPQPFSAHLSAQAFLAAGRTVQPANLLQLTSE